MASSKRTQSVKKSKKPSLVQLALLWLVSYLVLMSFFLGAITRNFNYAEIFPHELIFPSLMHGLTALLISLLLYWTAWLRTLESKLCSAVVLVLLLVGYDSGLRAVEGPIRALMPGVTGSDSLPLISLIYLLLLIGLAVWAGVIFQRLIPRFPRLKPQDIRLGIIVLAAYVFILPAFSVARILPAMIHQTATQAPPIPSVASQVLASDKPDIYYIVLDRYTNADVLKKQFNYDNRSFTEFLRGNNFTVNDHAYANYPYTAMSVASTLSANYTKDQVAPFKDNAVQSRTLYHNLVWQSSVIKSLQKSGYRYYTVGSEYGASYKAPLAERDYLFPHQLELFGATIKLRGIEANEFTGSPYYRFAQLYGTGWWPAKAYDRDHVTSVRDQLNTLRDITTKDKPGGRFIFAHILVPHDPFVFNADGSISKDPGTDSAGQPVKQKYVEQTKFINAQMQQLLANINKQSGGQAVVVLNSDEGPYPQFLNDTFLKPQVSDNNAADAINKNEDMRQWSDDWLKMKFGILQAVHIPRATDEDLAHLSSVNAFRIVLNRYAGTKLDYLPQCHFGLSNGGQNTYNYADLTQKFETNPDPACADLQSLPK